MPTVSSGINITPSTTTSNIQIRRPKWGHYKIYEMTGPEFLTLAEADSSLYSNQLVAAHRGAESLILVGSGIHATANDDGLVVRETWKTVCVTGTVTTSSGIDLTP